MNEPIVDVRALFQKTFGTAPSVVARAPGRVEVLGNHTDYNEGVVLSAAINREICVAAGPAGPGGGFELVSSHFADPVRLDIVEKQPGGRAWANYPMGVWQVLRDSGYPVTPFRLAVCGNVPLGAGVSSSAALEVSTVLALCRLGAFDIERTKLARICQKAENEFVGMKCGLLDQFSSLFGKAGHLLFIDFRTLAHKTVAIPDPDLGLVISLSGVAHSLVESAYNDRRRECFGAAAHFNRNDPSVKTLRDVTPERYLRAEASMDPLFFKRGRHIVGENDRVSRAIAMLERGDLTGFGSLLYESHESSRCCFENSVPQLDELVQIARATPGVLGSRLTGGGFGGATLTVLRRQAVAGFEKAVTAPGGNRTGRHTTVHVAQIADGASVVSD